MMSLTGKEGISPTHISTYGISIDSAISDSACAGVDSSGTMYLTIINSIIVI